MAIRRIQKEKEAQETDKKRKEAKQKVKEKVSKKGANTIYREYTTEEIAAMSTSKRRFYDKSMPKTMGSLSS